MKGRERKKRENKKKREKGKKERKKTTNIFAETRQKASLGRNKAGYTATLVACGWAKAVLEKVTRASGQEPYALKAQKRRKS